MKKLINEERYKRILTQNNYKKLKNIKEEIQKQKEEYFNDIKTNYLDGFRRSFTRLKFKLDILKSPPPTTEKFMETEVDYPFLCQFTNRDIYFHNPTLDIKDVYSRLYNKGILLPKDYKSVTIKKEQYLQHIEKALQLSKTKKAAQI